MGNSYAVPNAGPQVADMDKFIINVTFCDCKAQISLNTEVVRERRDEVKVNEDPDTLDQEAVEETVKDDQGNTGKLTSFDDLIPETLICGAMIKDDKEKEINDKEDNKDCERIRPLINDQQEINDKEEKNDCERIEHLIDGQKEINENEAEGENNISSGYGSPEFSDKDEELDYDAFEKSLDFIEDEIDGTDETESESKCQEDILKEFFEVTTHEENFLKRRDSMRRSFHSMSDLRKRLETSSPSHSVTLDPNNLEGNLDKDDLEESLSVGPALSDESGECPDNIDIIEDLGRSNKRGKSKLNLPVNMSIQNIKKTLLTMSPREQRKGRKGRGKRTSSMIIIL